MNRRLVVFALVACALLLTSCTYDRTALPVVTRYAAVQSAAQQDVLARAIDAAVEQLQPPAGEGRTVACTMAGVLPHAETEAGSYIRSRVDAQLAASGWRVADSGPVQSRCVIAVAVAGADVKEVRDELSPGRVAANVFLQFPTLFTSWIWFPIHPTKRFYVSHVRLTLSLISDGAGAGDAFWEARGEADVRLLFDGPDKSHYPLVEGTTFRDVSERHLRVE